MNKDYKHMIWKENSKYVYTEEFISCFKYYIIDKNNTIYSFSKLTNIPYMTLKSIAIKYNIPIQKERENHLGEIGYNKQGSKMKIVVYNNATDIVVEFEKGNRVHTRYEHFKNGAVTNVYERSVYGVGYYGEGKYVAKINGKHTPYYKTWNDMMIRAYSNKLHKKFKTYKDCKVCEEWHNFQNFAKWYEENYYEIEGEKMHLDKDILVKGNKLYSPETCVFVPQRINSLFTKGDKRRNIYPIGVSLYKKTNKYVAHLNKNDKRKTLGYFDNTLDAFNCYKQAKENYIKEVADQYKDKIPKKLYDAMYKYEVEITD